MGMYVKLSAAQPCAPLFQTAVSFQTPLSEKLFLHLLNDDKSKLL